MKKRAMIARAKELAVKISKAESEDTIKLLKRKLEEILSEAKEKGLDNVIQKAMSRAVQGDYWKNV